MFLLTTLQPFVPDFWESSHPAKADEGRSGELLVVAAAETQFSASPTHKLVQDEEGIRDGLETSSPKGQGGLLNDMAEDMGIPIDSIYKLFK
jgi:hypothetical protein